jgi:flagella basal body P-ring formation protein FlgA
MTVPNFTVGQVLTAAELDTLRSALGMTIPDFVAGQVLTAAELNELVDVANNAIFYGVATGGTSSSITVSGVNLHDAQVHYRQQHCCFNRWII